MGAENVDVESARGQNVAENNFRDTTGQDTDTTEFVPVPEKRKNRARCVSIILCTITAILVLIFCIVNRTVIEYHPRPTQKNTTDVCYMKEEKLTFSGWFTTALGLLGVVLGTLVDRLSLIAEEHHHLRQRCGGSWKKMIKSCFSGILWGPVIALLGSTVIILVILIFVTSLLWFELRYLVYIFSGIGVGPLIMHLLNLNTQSEVHISTILEEKGMFVANGLAWSYYFNYLKQALPKFKESTSRPFRSNENIKLSLNKLLLLIPHDCHMTDDLKTLDNNISKLFTIPSESFRFPVYRLIVSEHKVEYFVIKYVREPLKTLREMSKLEDIKAVKRKTCEEEVKLLYKTLSHILQDPPDEDFKGKCILVPIEAKNLEELQNGGLVKCIMDIVRPSHSDRVDGVRGFAKPTGEKLLCVNLSNSFKSDCKFARLSKNGDSLVLHNEQQGKGKQVDSETNKKQDNNSNDKKRKKRGEKLCRNNKNQKSDEIELVMMPAENHDPSHNEQRKLNKDQQLVQEVGDENDSDGSTSGNNLEWVNNANDSGASTSGYSLEIVHTPNGNQESAA